MADNNKIMSMTSQVLEIVSPDEKVLVEFYKPEQSSSGSTARGPQGFGASEAIFLFLPFVYSFFQKYVEGIGSEAGKKSFSAISKWILHKNDSNLQSARMQIRETLIKQGMPAESLEISVESILKILSKEHA